MDLTTLTDAQLDSLRQCRKSLSSFPPAYARKLNHEQWQFQVRSLEGNLNFSLIVRQSLLLASNFSCGLLWHASEETRLMLIRYNGSDHDHVNLLENEKFSGMCHIHKATTRYIRRGRKAEHFAEQTSRYDNVNGALRCLLEDCSIFGFDGPSI